MRFNSIRSKLISGFISITIIFLLVSAFSIYQLNQLEEKLNDMVKIELEFYKINQKLAFNIAERSTNVRGFMLSGHSKYIDNFKKLTAESIELENRLSNMSSLQADKTFIKRSEKWRNLAFNTIIPMYQRGNKEKATKIVNEELAPEGAELINIADGMANTREENLKTKVNEALKLETFLKNILTISTGIAIILSITLALLMSNIITKSINDLLRVVNDIANGDLREKVNIKSEDEIGMLGEAINKMASNLKTLINESNIASKQVTTSSEELLASSNQTAKATDEVAQIISEIANSSSEQAKNIEEGVVQINELGTDIELIAESSSDMDAVSKNTDQLTKQGLAIVQTLVKKSQESNLITVKVNEAVLKVDESTKEIGIITAAISQISEQTNLLALNASIEAARAGEAGRGFAVVADEIRKLAEQSSKSVEDINRILQGIQNHSNIAVSSMVEAKEVVNKQMEAVESTKKIFNDISKSIGNLINKVSNVATSSITMNDKKENIIAMIEDLSAIFEETAASTEEISASTEEQSASMEEVANLTGRLTTLAKNLQKTIKKFQV